MRKVKLLHVQLFPILSGAQRISLEEFRRLDNSNFELHLVTNSHGPFCDAAVKLGVHCHRIAYLKRQISPLQDYLAFRALYVLMREHAFDIVHTHSSKPGVLGRLAARSAKIPAIVHTVHGFAFPATRNRLLSNFYQQCEILCRPRTDALICSNTSDLQFSISKLGFSPDAVRHIPNGVDTSKYQPLENVEQRHRKRQELLPGDPQSPVVMMVGRLWEQKQPLTFVNAAAAVLAAGLKAQFYLIGEGYLREALSREIQRKQLGSHVKLCGWHDNVEEILPLADVVVLPSQWEGMPLVLLESQACGVPTVASDIPGNRACVVDKSDGFLVAPGDERGFARKIQKLLLEKDLRQQMSRAARSKVVIEFAIESRIARIANLYAQLLPSCRFVESPTPVCLPRGSY